MLSVLHKIILYARAKYCRIPGFEAFVECERYYHLKRVFLPLSDLRVRRVLSQALTQCEHVWMLVV